MTSLVFYLMAHDVFWMGVSMQSVTIPVHYKLIRKILLRATLNSKETKNIVLGSLGNF